MTNVSRCIQPTLGINLSEILVVGDARYSHVPLGTVVRGANGRLYVYVEATGSIADNTAVILTEGGPPPAFTVASGAGAYTTRSGALSATNRAWVESNAVL